MSNPGHTTTGEPDPPSPEGSRGVKTGLRYIATESSGVMISAGWWYIFFR